MPDAPPPTQITELKVSAHLMTLESGVFCIFQKPGGTAPDGSGLPGVRITLPPAADPADRAVEFGGFRDDGWVGEYQDALLLRVRHPAQVLVTVYQAPGDRSRAPSLQVVRVAETSVVADPAAPPPAAPENGAPGVIIPANIDPASAELTAHIQSRGDIAGQIGEWMGEPGSGRWIEGYAIAPKALIGEEDVEYQAVLGRGWLSPWVEGGSFCGSRGMALPILGLRVRLRGASAETHELTLEASFTDGSRVGPVAGDIACESDNLAPLEAFRLVVTPRLGALAPAAPAPAAKPGRRAGGKPRR